jgi:hypothetical protein
MFNAPAELTMPLDDQSVQEDIMKTLAREHNGYELHFAALGNLRHSLSFPCDAQGRVDMDALDERLLDHYLYARALRGHEYRFPEVRRRCSCPGNPGQWVYAR